MTALRLCLVLAAALLAGCFPSQPPEHGPRQLAVDGPYTQRASGMVFPEAVGAFERVSVIEYEPSGFNVSAGYNLVRTYGAVVATVYVYPEPATITCAREFEGVKGAVMEAHPGAVLVEEKAVAAPDGDSAVTGRMAAFTFRGDFARETRDLRSEAYLFCDVSDRWLVKYRFTAPADFPAEGAIAGFMRDLRWTL